MRLLTLALPLDLDAIRVNLSRHLADAQSAVAAACDPCATCDRATTKLHLLSTLDPAIRCAQDYFTCHPSPTSLFRSRPGRDVRRSLLAADEAHAHIAARSAIRFSDLVVLRDWLDDVVQLLDAEAWARQAHAQQRAAYAWAAAPESFASPRERALSFLRTFDASLPDHWDSPQGAGIASYQNEHASPGVLLDALASGTKLVELHNTLVAFSARKFGAIPPGTWHVNTSVPYRAAENLRFWIKAAELRWSVKLDVDVLGVVFDKGPEAWTSLDEAVLQWAEVVRREIVGEWDSVRAM